MHIFMLLFYFTLTISSSQGGSSQSSSQSSSSQSDPSNSDVFNAAETFSQIHLTPAATDATTSSHTGSSNASRLITRSSDTNMTPCERELGLVSDGRYPLSIALEFPRDAVRAVEPDRNMVCECMTEMVMICTIVVRANSVEDVLVARRLDRGNLDRLLPFFIRLTVENFEIETAPIVYEHSDVEPPVYAEIVVDRTFPEMSRAASSDQLSPPRATLTRSNSAPSELHYPTIYMRPSRCSNTMCPITHQEFYANDIVYILRDDLWRISANQDITCFSATALRQVAEHANNTLADGRRQFRDPLRRADEFLTLEDNYVAVILWVPHEPVNVVVHPDGSISFASGTWTQGTISDRVLRDAMADRSPNIPIPPHLQIQPPPLRQQYADRGPISPGSPPRESFEQPGYSANLQRRPSDLHGPRPEIPWPLHGQPGSSLSHQRVPGTPVTGSQPISASSSFDLPAGTRPGVSRMSSSGTLQFEFSRTVSDADSDGTTFSRPDSTGPQNQHISQDPPVIAAPNHVDAAEPDLETFEPQDADMSSSDSDRVSIGFAHGDFSFQRKVIFLIFTFFTLYSLYTFTSKTELPDHKYLQLL